MDIGIGYITLLQGENGKYVPEIDTITKKEEYKNLIDIETLKRCASEIANSLYDFNQIEQNWNNSIGVANQIMQKPIF